MATSDFLVFAGSGGANVITQSAYASLAALGPGFSSGVAASNQLNKVWRQSSIIAAVVAQYIADATGANSVDDGTTATLLSNLHTALSVSMFNPDTGAVNAYAVTFPHGITAPQDGQRIRFRPAHSNTGASTFSANGSSPVAILNGAFAALSGGEIVANGCCELEYDAAHTSWVIVNNAGGIATVNSTNGAAAIAYVNSSGVIQHQAGPYTVAITHSSTGVYAVAISPALPSANFVITITCDGNVIYAANITSRSATGFTFNTVSTTTDAVADSAFNLHISY